MIGFVVKNMSRSGLRSVLTILGILIGAATITSLVSVSTGLQIEANSALGKLQGIYVWQKDVIDQIFSRLPMSDVEDIKARVGDYNVVTPQVYALPTSIDGEPVGFSLSSAFVIGIVPGEDQLARGGISASIIDGENIRQKGEALIGKNLADDKNKFVGDIISVDGKDFRIVGIFELGSRFLDSAIVTNLEDAQSLAGFDSKTISLILFDPADPSQSELLAQKIDVAINNVQAKTQQQSAQQVGDLLSTMKAFHWIISSIAAIVGGIGVANTMLMSVYERMKDIGIMRAVGWTQRNVMFVFIFEALLLGFVGGLLGIGLGFAAVYGIIRPLTQIPATITLTLAIEVMVFSMSLGLIGGFYPAWKAANLDPIEALRYE